MTMYKDDEWIGLREQQRINEANDREQAFRNQPESKSSSDIQLMLAEIRERLARYTSYHSDPYQTVSQLRVDVNTLLSIIDSLQTELNSAEEIFRWFTKKLDAIKLEGTTPQDVMAAFREIISTCRRAKGMIRLSVPTSNKSSVQHESESEEKGTN